MNGPGADDHRQGGEVGKEKQTNTKLGLFVLWGLWTIYQHQPYQLQKV